MTWGCERAVIPLRDLSSPVAGWPGTAVLYLADHLGSPIVMVDDAGAATHETPRHPYGAPRGGERNVGDPWDYVGNEADEGSGLADFHARPYRPELGRFYGSEPLLHDEPRSLSNPWHLLGYAYAASDPVDASDGSGLQVIGIGGTGSLTLVLGGDIGTGVFLQPRWPIIGVYSTAGVSLGPQAGVALDVELTIAPASTAEEVWDSPSPSPHDVPDFDVEVAVRHNPATGSYRPRLFEASGGMGPHVGISLGFTGEPAPVIRLLGGVGAETPGFTLPIASGSDIWSGASPPGRTAAPGEAAMDASVPSAPSSDDPSASLPCGDNSSCADTPTTCNVNESCG